MVLNKALFFLIAIILVTLGCGGKKMNKDSITVDFSDSNELYQEISLIRNGKVASRQELPRHDWWAQKTLHTFLKTKNLESVEQGWSCQLRDSLFQNSNNREEYDFLAYEDIFKQASKYMNFENTDKALDFFLNNFFHQGLFSTSQDKEWEYCEELYRSQLMELTNSHIEYNNYGLKYIHTGLDICQVSELLNINVVEKALESNQYIISPSACFLLEREKEISNKPYFIVTIKKESNNYDLKIELLNKLHFYNWLSL